MAQIGSFLLLLGLLVFVHELGHFLAAKAVGVKVLRFSIGFGPKLVGFTRGDTEYWIAALPLGGYVKMAGEVPGEDTSPEDEARSYLAQSPWKRMLIVVAGPAFNLIFPLLVLFLAVVSFPQPSTRVLTLEPGMPAAESGMKLGDVITEIDGQSVHTFDEMRRVIEPRVGQRIPITVERDGQPVKLVLTPVRSPTTSTPARPKGMIGVAYFARPPWLGIPAGSAAEKLGLRTFDRVVSLDGQPVTDQYSLLRHIDAAKGSEFKVEVLRRDPAGVPGVDLEVPRTLRLTVPRQPGTGLAALGVESGDLYVGRVVDDSAAARAGVVAGDRLVSVDGEPLISQDGWARKLETLREKPFQLVWLHQGVERKAEVHQNKVTRKDEFTGQEASGLDLGIRQGTHSGAERPQPDLVRVGPGEALAIAFRKLVETVVATAGGLAMLLTGQVSFKNVGGPIMIYDIASRAAQAGLEPFLNLMAAISVNLGLINLVPIPALDGFQLLSSAWEAIRRRPIPMRAREIANAVGILALIVLMVLVCVNDLTR